MALTQEQLAKFVEHINKKWKSKNCLLCGANNWDVLGYVPLSLADEPGAVVLGGKIAPTVAIVCKECGQIVLVNSLVAGVTTP
jgi:hypothetical protein